jgi:hypothetical protein
MLHFASGRWSLSEPSVSITYQEWFRQVPPPLGEAGVNHWRNLVWFDFHEAYTAGLSPEEAAKRASEARKTAVRTQLTTCPGCNLLVQKSILEVHQEKNHSKRARRPLRLKVSRQSRLVTCPKCGATMPSSRMAKHSGSRRCLSQSRLERSYPTRTKSSVWTVGGGLPDSARRKH